MATSTSSDADSGIAHKTLIIILSSVLPVVAVLVAAIVFFCCRSRQRKRCKGKSFLPRGISPIDDDEIETWKGHNPLGMDEKEGSVDVNDASVDGDTANSPPSLSDSTLGASVHHPQGPPPVQPRMSRARGVSLDSASAGPRPSSRPNVPRRTPSNVIVYRPNTASSTSALHRSYSSRTGSSVVAATPAGAAAVEGLQQQQQQQQQYMHTQRQSEEFAPRSARSLSLGQQSSSRGMAGRFSSDQDQDFPFQMPALATVTPTALQHACAPNSRAGLTDEAVPGDPSFLPTLKRQSSRSRLVKMPPPVSAGNGSASRRRSNSLTGRTRSRRSSSAASGRSHAGHDAGLTQQPGMSHQRHPSQTQRPYFGHARPRTPPKPSPVSTVGLQESHPSLEFAASLPSMHAPPPVSTRGGGSASHNRQTSQSRDHNLASSRNSGSIYRDYMNLYQPALAPGGVMSMPATGDSDGSLPGLPSRLVYNTSRTNSHE